MVTFLAHRFLFINARNPRNCVDHDLLQHPLIRKSEEVARSLVTLLSSTALANMSVAVSAPPNPQPSQPQERAYHHLPPKSYAEATVGGAVKHGEVSSPDPNGVATVVEPLNSKLSEPHEQANENLPTKSYAVATVEGIDNDAGESLSESNGDAAVAEPLNLPSSQPQERTNHPPLPKPHTAAIVEGTDKDVRELRSEACGAAGLSGVNGSVKVNGLRRNIDEDRVLYDKHTSPKGEKLTSIKPDESYEEGLKHDADSAPRQKGRSGKKQDPNGEKLASGRRAGAGWERSASVFLPEPLFTC
jgi:2-acylglycerol O-acyltransferase 2